MINTFREMKIEKYCCKYRKSYKHTLAVVISVTSLMLSTGLPPNSTTTSPGRNPACSAGDPGVT